MFNSSGHGKLREKSSRRMNYRVESFADADVEDDGCDDTESPYFDPTDLSDTEFCGCTRSAANMDATRRDRPRRKASRLPSQVPCAVEADSLPLARPIPLHYDSDMFDTWCNKSGKLKRNSVGEKYQENRGGDGAIRGVGSKFKTTPLTSPPPAPETLARMIGQSLSRQSAVGVGTAAPSATTPRYYRRSTRAASRRPSRLCLPVASQLDPAFGGRRPSMHATRSQQVATSMPAIVTLPAEARAEVKIPVRAHVTYVPRGVDSPRGGSAHTRRRQTCGEIRIPLDLFASPYRAYSTDVGHWTHHLNKSSSHRVHRRSQTKVQPMCSHLTAQPVMMDRSSPAPLNDRHAALLRKHHSVEGAGEKPRAASDKPPQKHRAPSVRSRASETLLPHAVQSNLDAMLTSYEAQLTAPSAQRHKRCSAACHWGNRPDPRKIPIHLLKPRKPESVKQRELLTRLEENLRSAMQPRTQDAQPTAQHEDATPSTATVEAPSAQPPAPSLPSAAPSAAPKAAPTAAPTAPAARPASSAEGKFSNLLNDLVKSGFDVSKLEQRATGAAKAEGLSKTTPTPTPPKSVKNNKVPLDPRGYYEALYNQQSLVRVDVSEQMNACKASTPAEVTATLGKSASRHKVDVDTQSCDEQQRPHPQSASECAHYASQDDDSVYNQDFWDTLDYNVDLNSVQSLSDGFDGHEDSYKYFRDGKIPSTTKRVSSHSALPHNLGDPRGEQRTTGHVSVHELFRHGERRLSRSQSAKQVAGVRDQPPLDNGYYHWPNSQGKSSKGGHRQDRNRTGCNECHEDQPKRRAAAAESSPPASSHGGVDGVPTQDADEAERIQLSKSLIAEVVEETLKRREKTCNRIKSQTKMDVLEAIDLIKQKSSSMNDALCLEIAKALTDRLVDCESAKSEEEYLTQLKKLRSDHLRHISREVKRLQDLEGFLDDFGHVRSLYDSACATRDNEGK